MIYNVILTPRNGRFVARVAELPACKVMGDDREKVLSLIENRLKEIIKGSEIVQLHGPELGKTKRSPRKKSSAPATKPPNLVRVSAPIAADDKTVHLETPWEFYGIFKDDPTWLPMLEKIERERDRHIVHPKRKKVGKG